MPLPIPPGAIAAAGDLSGQATARMIGNIANGIFDASRAVRVNAETAAAVSRRASAMAAEMESVSADGLHEHCTALQSFQRVLAKTEQTLSAHGRQSYFSQLLHRIRDKNALVALSEEMKNSFSALMLALRIQTDHMLSALIAQTEVHTSTCESVLEALEKQEAAPLATIPPKPQIFLGRDAETAEVVTTLTSKSSGRVAILGGPGMGKTTLALSVLHDPAVAGRFPTRFFIPCDAAEGRTSCLPLIAEALGVLASDPGVQKRSLTELLGAGPTLLALDNFESAWEPPNQRDDAEQVLQFLDSIEGLSLILTMRGTERPQGLCWTRPFLPPLGPLSDISALQTYASIAPMTEQEDVIKGVLSQMDNIPLAIILMANLAQSESPAILLARWNELQTSMLIRGDGQNRLSSLDVSIRLSLESARMRTAPETRLLLALLSLLPHGVVDSDVELWNIYSSARGLSVLLRTALATRSEDRVRVLAPIRSFMLWHHPPSDDNLQSIYSHFFGLAELAKQSILLASRPETIRGLAIELANIEFVIRYALEHSQTQDRGAIQAVDSLAFFYNEVCLGPGPQLLPAALAVARERQYHGLCADLLIRWGTLSFNGAMSGDPQSLFREASNLHKRFSSTDRVIASGLHLMRYLSPRDGVVEARQLFEMAKSLKDYRRMAEVSDKLSRAYLRLGKPVEALALRTRAITLIQLAIQNGTNERLLGIYRFRLGRHYHLLGDLDRAEPLYRDAISILEAARAGFASTQARMGLADMFLDQGRTSYCLATVSRVGVIDQAPAFRPSLQCLILATQAHALEGNVSAATDAVERFFPSRPADSFSAHDLVYILIAQSSVAWSSGDFAGMHDALVVARTRARGGDRFQPPEMMLQTEAHVLRELGEAAYAQNGHTDAYVLACTAAIIHRKGNKVETVKSLVLLAEVADDACAELILSAVLPPAQKMGLSLDISRAFLRSATIAKARGREDLARRFAKDSLDSFDNIKGDWRIPLAMRIAHDV